MDEIPRIYCINLRSSEERRKRMIQRFSHHNLLDRVTFVDAVSRDSGLVDHYGHHILDPRNIKKHRNEVACFASHLKAIRQFLEETSKTEDEGAIICEDDVLLSNDFLKRYNETFANIPDNSPLIALGYIIWHWSGYKWAGNKPDQLNLCKITPENTWGAQMYWISRKYAVKALEIYDKPLQFLSGHLTSELIIRFSEGYIAYPPLAIEDSIDSSIRPTQDMEVHYRTQSRWGYSNYSDTETVHLSPLAPVELRVKN